MYYINDRNRKIDRAIRFFNNPEIFRLSDSSNQSEISKYIASCRVFWVGSYLFFSSGHVRSFPIAISAF